jgi:hypothetical protein
MNIDLSLSEIRPPKDIGFTLEKPTRALCQIADRNRRKFEGGYETVNFRNRKEDLVRKLKLRSRSWKTFEQLTDVVGRQRLLLSIYITYLGTPNSGWLPPFDQRVAASLLGESGMSWRVGRRLQVTRLFFTHFDKIEAIQILCRRLREAYSSQNSKKPNNSNMMIWMESSSFLFSEFGPKNIADQAETSETLPNLMKRFAIPREGNFAGKLRQVYLLNKLDEVPFGGVNSAFSEIEDLKEELASDNLHMGAAALQKLVTRVKEENNGKWAGNWNKWIKSFGCDPRYGRRNAEGIKWWGWATDSELRIAMRGITELNLQFFINFLKNSLEGTPKESQFEGRARFLMDIFESGKIDSARLALNKSDYITLDPKYRDPQSVAILKSTPDKTSMICLRCVDNIFIIEGTYSFGLRVFQRVFPIKNFWEEPGDFYMDSSLRVSPRHCPVFIRHDQGGNWVRKFFEELRSKFHVEWAISRRHHFTSARHRTGFK